MWFVLSVATGHLACSSIHYAHAALQCTGSAFMLKTSYCKPWGEAQAALRSKRRREGFEMSSKSWPRVALLCTGCAQGRRHEPHDAEKGHISLALSWLTIHHFPLLGLTACWPCPPLTVIHSLCPSMPEACLHAEPHICLRLQMSPNPLNTVHRRSFSVAAHRRLNSAGPFWTAAQKPGGRGTRHVLPDHGANF